jgi:hypothetical protein
LESGEFNSHCGDWCESDAVYINVFFQQLVLTPQPLANADRLHLGDCQYQSVEFYNTEKRLIDRYEEFLVMSRLTFLQILYLSLKK